MNFKTFFLTLFIFLNANALEGFEALPYEIACGLITESALVLKAATRYGDKAAIMESINKAFEFSYQCEDGLIKHPESIIIQRGVKHLKMIEGFYEQNKKALR